MSSSEDEEGRFREAVKLLLVVIVVELAIIGGLLYRLAKALNLL